jgi:hypothetical protein
MRIPRTPAAALLAAFALAPAPLPAAPAATAAAPAIEHQVGVATAAADGRVLYREYHWRYDDAGVPRRLVLYRCPDGSPFARKLVDERGGSAPDFEFVDGRDGSSEAVARHAGGRSVRVRDGDGGEHRADIPERADAVIDAGFDTFVRAHWTQLGQGRALVAPFLVPDRSGWLDFRIHRERDAVEAGLPVRRIRMTLAAWFGFIVPAIELTYARDGLRLLRFEGPGYVRNDAGKHPKVRIDFPVAPRAGDAAALAQARRVPLTGRCPG